MAASVPKSAQPDTTQVSFQLLSRSFQRSLAAENKSPLTVSACLTAVHQFGEFLADQGMPSDPADIAREHVESFIAALLVEHKLSTVNQKYRALQQFFKWLDEEGEITGSPMRNMKPPTVPEESPEVLTDDQIKRLLKTCEGKDFTARRDTAIIRLLMDTGMPRRAPHRCHTNDRDGVSSKIVQERLGHSDITMTLHHYSHVTMDTQREAADRMDSILGVANV